MAVNKNALIRYKTIDKCLQNKYREWTLEDLIDACSDALYEYEGIDKGVSRRTVQADIQMMRSDKLGYNAPIVVVDKKFYTYEDPDYSITNIPITEQDLSKLNEAVQFLKQFQGFSHFRELDSMIQKLEDHVYSQKTNQRPVIDFEKNENLRGLEYLDQLYRSIINKQAISITYQSFKARQPNTFDFHPYLLKEFRNRWFLVGCKKPKEGILNLALDRILEVAKSDRMFKESENFDAATYFENAIGVSVSPTLVPQTVRLSLSRKHAPYILTKPLHHTQKVVEEEYHQVVIELQVVHNFELEKEILSYGEEIKVLEPERLRRNIFERLQATRDRYETELTPNLLKHTKKQFAGTGSSVIRKIYTQREVRKMKHLMEKQFKDTGEERFGKRNFLNAVPGLRELLFNKNLNELVQSIDGKAKLTKCIYFNKPAASNWYVTWHQDITLRMKEKKQVEGFKGWTNKDREVGVIPPLKYLENNFTIRIHLDETNDRNGALYVIPGSHKKILEDGEIALITQNANACRCDVALGGIHLMHPLLLHRSGESTSKKSRRVIHLEFSAAKLPEGLEFAEV